MRSLRLLGLLSLRGLLTGCSWCLRGAATTPPYCDADWDTVESKLMRGAQDI